MSHWTELQMTIFVILNLLTALSYFTIPVAWGWAAIKTRQFGLNFLVVHFSDNYLFGAFVAACGVHHVAMSFLHQDPDAILSILIIDGTMAVISLSAAVKSLFNVRSVKHYDAE